MRIGMVCPYSFDEPGGVQSHIVDVSRWLIRHGHSVRVIGPCSEQMPVDDFIVKGGPSFPVPFNGSVARLSIGPRVTARVREFIGDGGFDVLHIHEPASPSYSLEALRLAHGPIVATFHTFGARSRLLSWASPLLKPQFEKIRAGIAVSDLARRFHVNQLGGDPILIPNGVDTALFNAAWEATDRTTGTSRPVEIAFLGRTDEPRKGLSVLLDALEGLPGQWHLTVMGQGRGVDTQRVRYEGKVSDERKAQVLAAADIYVAPNTGGESFGIVLVEAMAAGCAVVASDIEAFVSVTQATEPRPAGVTFRNGDSGHLRQVVAELVADPQRRARLVEQGFARARDFDWDTVGREIVAVYETVADSTVVRL